MSNKAIVEINLKDGEWRKFNESVKEHQKILSKMPGQWGMVGGAIGKSSDKVAKMVANAKNVKDSFAQAKTITDKFVIGLQSADRTISSLVRGSASLAKNIASVTTSILKWGAGIAISGILSLGGLFATFGSMGKGIAGTRSESMQTGSTYGQTKAAEIVYGTKLGSGVPSSLMKMINEDINSGGALMLRAGLGREQFAGKSAGDVLPLYLQKMQDVFKQNSMVNGMANPAIKPIMEGRFPNQDFGMMKQIGSENMASMNARYVTESVNQNMSKGSQDLYTNFAIQMDSVWENAKNKIAQAFTPLIGPMTTLSNSLIKSMGTMFANKNVQNGIKDFGKGIEKTAIWIASKEGQQAISDGIDSVARFAKAVYDVAMYVQSLIPSKEQIGATGAAGGAIVDIVRKPYNDVAAGIDALQKTDFWKWRQQNADESSRKIAAAQAGKSNQPGYNHTPVVVHNRVTVHSDSIPGTLAAQSANH